MIVVRRSRPRDPERVQQEMEAVFRTLMVPGRPAARLGSRLWRPAVEVYETPDELVVRAEIAGMDEGRLNVVIDGDLLMIRGDRPDPRRESRRSPRSSSNSSIKFWFRRFTPMSRIPTSTSNTLRSNS